MGSRASGLGFKVWGSVFRGRVESPCPMMPTIFRSIPEPE